MLNIDVFIFFSQILPSELSDVIRLHPYVQDAAVSALPHPQDGHQPLAFVSLKPGKSMTEDEVNEHILSKYATFIQFGTY